MWRGAPGSSSRVRAGATIAVVAKGCDLRPRRCASGAGGSSRSPRRAVRRAAAGRATDDHRRAGGSGDHSHAGDDAARCDALEHAGHGEGDGAKPDDVSRIWRAFGLQPHRTETFKLSPDPLLIDKVRDIVGLYMNPPEHAWYSASTRNRRSRRSTARSRCLPMQPGQVERRTHDYKRHGTTSLFAALETKTSPVITQLHQRHRSVEFRKFLDVIERACPGTWTCT